jgi:hypothetical protein
MVFNNIDIEELRELLLGTNGKIFTATFIKKNGEVRDINARLGVKSYIKGTGSPSYTLRKDNPYQLVFDLQKQGYRAINMDTLTAIKFNKNEYRIGGLNE